MPRAKQMFHLGDTVRHKNGKDYKIVSMNSKFVVAIGPDNVKKTDVVGNFVKVV